MLILCLILVLKLENSITSKHDSFHVLISNEFLQIETSIVKVQIDEGLTKFAIAIMFVAVVRLLC